ncbi:cell wall-binding repeat-containing protein [Clostridioides mangenotii]|uniref:cell wall-binding repeat-containing protein n=1 Tax=Metaclostridioides mangenotii TaxID=1540 RepID=UPI001C11F109|nr:cell wall-binding repeat-containing protein [Clostridioides mangenotii]MBU5307790.1 cell wall-binding repeat-containing protein [Clostridioides mangenotii]
MKFKKTIAFMLVGTFFMSTVTPSFAYFKKPALERLQGSDNYETAALIADKQSYNSAILVNLDNSVADGLSASGLSGATNSPILLTKKDSIPTVTMKRLSSGVNKVYIIGGTNSVSSGIESTLKSKGITITRIQGGDRIETSINVANEIKKYTNSNYVFLLNGFKGEPDAISISPIACKYSAPIILTNGTSTNYSTSNKTCYVIGGANSMSEDIVTNKGATRISGNDRFETNQEVINTFLDEEAYSQMVTDGALKFYVADGYNLTNALVSTIISKDSLFALVSESNDKGSLYVAGKVIACGNLTNEVIENCLAPYPVYGDMFGIWKSESDESKQLIIDPESLMIFRNDEPIYSDYDDSSWKTKSVDKKNNIVIIQRTTASGSTEYNRLTKISDTRIKIETSSNINSFGQPEYYNPDLIVENESASYDVIEEFGNEIVNNIAVDNYEESYNIPEEYVPDSEIVNEILGADPGIDFSSLVNPEKLYSNKLIIRVSKVKTAGKAFNVAIFLSIGKTAAIKGLIKKKGKAVVKKMMTQTLARRLKSMGAKKLVKYAPVAAGIAIEYIDYDFGLRIAKYIDSIDPKPNNGYIEVSN